MNQEREAEQKTMSKGNIFKLTLQNGTGSMVKSSGPLHRSFPRFITFITALPNPQIDREKKLLTLDRIEKAVQQARQALQHTKKV